MKVLVLLVLLLVPFSTTAQQSADTTETLKAKVKKFRNSKRFVIKHDKFKDVTVVRAWFLTGTGRGWFAGGFTFSGERPDAQYFFLLETSSRRWRHLDPDDQILYALLDGERLNLGTGDHDGTISIGAITRNVSVNEQIVFPLSADTFRKMANSKSAELKIGSMEFRLKDEHQEAFRDLLSLSQP